MREKPTFDTCSFDQYQKFMSLSVIFRSARAQVILYVCAAVYGMIFSAPAVISIAMILLVLVGPLRMRRAAKGKISITWRENIGRRWSERQRHLWIAVPFLLVVFSLPYTEDFTYAAERLRIKLPFLLLPLAFAALPALRRRDVRIIGAFFVGILTVAAVGVLWKYYQNFAIINESLEHGKSIPTPSSHIRFSLAVAGGIFCAGALSLCKGICGTAGERYGFGFLTIFLFIFLHILSVRSGLLAFYTASGILLLRYIYASGNRLLGTVGLLLLLAVPTAAVMFVPSLQSKYQYVKYDLEMSLRGEGKSYSDGERWISLRAARDIITEHPLFGVGAGDLRKEMYEIYQRESSGNAVAKMPHSQFASVAAGTGIVGLILFLIGFFKPIFWQNNYRNYLFLAWHVIIFSSFLSENTFETNFGVSLWLFGLLIGLSYEEESSVAHSVTVKERSM